MADTNPPIRKAPPGIKITPSLGSQQQFSNAVQHNLHILAMKSVIAEVLLDKDTTRDNAIERVLTAFSHKDIGGEAPVNVLRPNPAISFKGSPHAAEIRVCLAEDESLAKGEPDIRMQNIKTLLKILNITPARYTDRVPQPRAKMTIEPFNTIDIPKYMLSNLFEPVFYDKATKKEVTGDDRLKVVEALLSRSMTPDIVRPTLKEAAKNGIAKSANNDATHGPIVTGSGTGNGAVQVPDTSDLSINAQVALDHSRDHCGGDKFRRVMLFANKYFELILEDLKRGIPINLDAIQHEINDKLRTDPMIKSMLTGMLERITYELLQPNPSPEVRGNGDRFM